jgi:type I restriction enzyme, S subunit
VAKAEDFDGMFLGADDCEPISEGLFYEFKRSQAKRGDILIAIGGYVGRPAIVQEIPNGLALNINRHIARFRPNKQILNPYFALAYFSSGIGERQLTREITGSVQAGINLEDLRLVQCPLPEEKVQAYIGDKVRQAERLRARARIESEHARRMFEGSLFWSSDLEGRVLHRRIRPNELFSRLDLNYNSPSRMRLLDYLRKSGIKLQPLGDIVEVSAMIGWKGLTTEHYTQEGPWLLRGVEFNNGLINFEELVCVAQEKYDEQPQIHLREGDVAMTKDGTIGKAIVIPSLGKAMAAGSTVARLRPLPSVGINPYYIEHSINHSVLQIQIAGFATGMAQPHITQEWIEKLEVPRCSEEEEIGKFVRRHHEQIRFSDCLTTAAKLLVEALIEGKLSEAELKDAQEALERGEREADRAILARLTRKGIDVADEPKLFPDLNALYAALDQTAAENETAFAEGAA